MSQGKKAAGARKRAPAARKHFCIVGIGGSAGSLEPLQRFFSALPADNGMAFVVVQHLDPTQKDYLPELLQRGTKMPVRTAGDNMPVEPGNVYIIPPNKDLAIARGRLRLSSPAMPRGRRTPIDFFFRSLAAEAEERAVGVILSGMGSDGTLGVKAIKEKLGLVLVQAADSAKYDAMPRSAIETGLADFTAPPDKLPAKLLFYARHFLPAAGEAAPLGRQAEDNLHRILALLRNRTGHDFSFYKKSTIHRRVARRMSEHRLAALPKYQRYLQLHPEELDLLFKELLIGVTSFFRDPLAFDAVRKALPAILRGKPERGVIRVWDVGCSTGEEAYSLAILLREYLQEAGKERGFRVQIFATDIDKAAIEKARQGFYPAGISADVSPERLQKFFTKEDSGYRVRKEIRETIVFAPQNLIIDPPFTKLDILCCRNLLIYLTHEIQKRILPLFHYSLNPAGALFLGSSETIGSLSSLFSAVDGKWKVFKRKELSPSARNPLELPLLPAGRKRQAAVPEPKGALAPKLPLVAMERLLETFAPPALFISEAGEILYVSGRTGKYLEPAMGEASMNAFAMAREGLRAELPGAARKAARSKQAVTVKGLKVKTDGGYQLVDLVVKPFTRPESLRGVLMVVFEEALAGAPERRLAARTTPATKLSTRMLELEDELRYTKEHLQTTVEEMETAQEELKSANEELQSANEELQSTNEELTTSKEEMQSLNEELITVNAELQAKVDEISRANNDMKNLLNSTELATVFLDNELNVKRFTAPATRLINLIPADVGRPIGHIVSNLKYETLDADVREVLKTLVFKELHVETRNGAWYLMRIIPYRTFENVIDGVVITFTDLTEFKKLEQRCLRLEAGRKGGEK